MPGLSGQRKWAAKGIHYTFSKKDKCSLSLGQIKPNNMKGSLMYAPVAMVTRDSNWQAAVHRWVWCLVRWADSGFGSRVQKSQEKLSMYFISTGDRVQNTWGQKDSYRSLFYHSHFAKTEKEWSSRRNDSWRFTKVSICSTADSTHDFCPLLLGWLLLLS